jgi:hypothetical protein
MQSRTYSQECLRNRLTVRLSQLILSHMVNFKRRLDRTFMARVDPTRRAILAQLERGNGASFAATHTEHTHFLCDNALLLYASR